MSIINRNNYEIYFLDYLEGNLSPELRKEMELFLIKNPDLKEELDGLEDATLPDDKIVFEAKQVLKNLSLVFRPERFITDDEYLIAKIEDDLTDQEENDFELYLKQNPQVQNDYSLFLLSKLEADQSLIFENKSLLYRNEETIALSARPDRFLTDDDFLIAKIEGDLTPAEEKVFESYINENQAVKKEYSIFKQSILEPDQSIVFEHKSTLKRFEITPKYYLLRKYSVAVASVAAMLLFMTFFFFDREESPLISNNSNYLSLIHRSSENKENVMSENKLTFTGSPETNSSENQAAEFEIKIRSKLHAFAKLDNTKNDKPEIQVTTNKTDISQNDKTAIPENINRDHQQVNNEPIQTDNNKVADIGPKNVNTIIEKPVQISPAPKPKRTVKSSDKYNFTIWDLAIMGVRGLNNLAGSKIELKKQYDADGNVKSLAFNSPRLEFSTPVKKK
jgi:hypothetical protein